MKIYEENPIRIEAETYMILTNGEIYTNTVYLGKFDSIENWHEIPIEEAPHDE